MEILPCRFCGGKGEAVVHGKVQVNTAYVLCTKCNAHGPSVTFEWKTHDDLVNANRRAIELWNNCSIGESADTKPADTGWISVKERLPEPYLEVLVFAPYATGICIAYLTAPNPGQCWVVSLGGGIAHLNTYAVTHWMPLPDSPVEKEGC